MSKDTVERVAPVSEERANGSIEIESHMGKEKRTHSGDYKDSALHAAKKVRFNDVNTTHEFATTETDDQETEDPVSATGEGNDDSPDCGGHTGEDEGLDDLEPVMYGKDEVNRIRRRRKLQASRTRLGNFQNEDTEVDVVNSRAEAQAAQEADPEEQIGDGGIPMEPFNMRREMEEGSFDADGNYVWNKKGKSDHVTDGWLDSVDAGDSFSNFKNEEKRLKAVTDSSDLQKTEEANVAGLLRELSSILKNRETPAAALRRLRRTTEDHITPLNSTAQDRQKKVVEDILKEEKLNEAGKDFNSNNEIPQIEKQVQTTGKGEKSESSTSKVDPADAAFPTTSADLKAENNREKEKKEMKSAEPLLKDARSRSRGPKGRFKMTEEATREFERITEICDMLMAEGRNVYFLPRPDVLEAAVQQEEAEAPKEDQGVAGDDSTEAHSRIYWQFHWTGNQSNKEEYGPFESTMMQAWVDQGFFSESTPVEVRQVSEANDPLDGVWRKWNEVDFRHVAEGVGEETEDSGEAGELSGQQGTGQRAADTESPDSPEEDPED